jgi:hypothetical protein
MASTDADMPESSKSATCDDCNTGYITSCEKSNVICKADKGDPDIAYQELDTACDEPNTAYDSIASSDSNLTAATGAYVKAILTNDTNLQSINEYLKPNDEYLQPNIEYLQPNIEYLQGIATNLHCTPNLQQPVLSLSTNTQRPALPLPANIQRPALPLPTHTQRPLFSRQFDTQQPALLDQHAEPDQLFELDGGYQKPGAASHNALVTNRWRGKR